MECKIESQAEIELDSLLDDFFLGEHSDDLLKKLFKFPLGSWVDIQYFFDKDCFVSNFKSSHIFVCWLNDVDGKDSNYRLIAFFDSNEAISQIISFNMNVLK